MSTQSVQQSIIRWLLALDVTPGPEIRALIEQELKRSASPEQITAVKYKAETREVESTDGEWENHEPTGKQWWTLTFTDGGKFTFERDSEGVRLGRDPDDPILLIG